MGVIPENANIMRYFGVWTYIQEEYIYICVYIYMYLQVINMYIYIYMHITNINVCVRKCGIPPRLLFKYAVIVMWILIHLIWWSLGCPIFRETLVDISDVISDAMNRFFPGNFTIFTSVFWQIRTGDTSGNRKPYEEMPSYEVQVLETWSSNPPLINHHQLYPLLGKSTVNNG